MKVSVNYSLTFNVGGIVKDYSSIITSYCGMSCEKLTRDNVHDYRALCELILQQQGISEFESRLVCLA